VGQHADDAGSDDTLPIDASLLDPSSGLFAEPFFLATVSWRLIACRRVLRPLSICLFEVVDGLPDGPVVPSDPNVITAMVKATLRTSDIAARMSDGTYGLMMEDTPEDGAVWAVERLRRSLGSKPGSRALRAGVACYPGHALTPADIVRYATSAFASAREWPQDRIEVAPTSG
jgi:hypothetical protein